MTDVIDRVNTWEIRSRPDGGFGVYDGHGMVAGPFGTRDKALDAAMHLARPMPPQANPPSAAAGQSAICRRQGLAPRRRQRHSPFALASRRQRL